MMRSGLYNHTSAPEIGESLDRDPARAWAPQELLAIAFKRPPNFAPGKDYEYCNTNYVLLGLIAEKLEGAPLARIFHDRLFRPLGSARNGSTRARVLDTGRSTCGSPPKI
jgi:D-alanyl-D-alanine carboxypeptidase